MVRVTEWRLKATDFPSTLALGRALGVPPFDFEVGSDGQIAWATYWFASEPEARAALILVVLAGWRGTVTNHELELDE